MSKLIPWHEYPEGFVITHPVTKVTWTKVRRGWYCNNDGTTHLIPIGFD